MDFELQPQQAHPRDLARQGAHEHLATYAAAVDRAAGLLDLLTPTHHGGSAVDW